MIEARKELISKLREDFLLWQGLESRENKDGQNMGLGQIERAFPNGVFQRKGIHEFISVLPEHAAASVGFIGALLSILMKDGAACVWISTNRKLFPPSLRLFNVDPERIIFMDVPREKDVLWVMEEALKCEGLAAVVAEVNTLSLIESRRLQLAVEKTGIPGFILRKDARKAVTSVATARWKISPILSNTEGGLPGIGFPRWNVELIKVRNGNPGTWTLEWAGDKFIEVPKIQQERAWVDNKQRQLG